MSTNQVVPEELPMEYPLDYGVFQRSAQVNELFTALSEAQGEMEHASKDSDNPYFKSRYADLASAISAARPHLAKYGLSVIQLPSVNARGSVDITTILGHKSGQYIQSTLTMNPLDPKPQTIGSCITYGRRYSYMAIVGVAGEDDDGNSASGKNEPFIQRREKPQANPERTQPNPDFAVASKPKEQPPQAPTVPQQQATAPIQTAEEAAKRTAIAKRKLELSMRLGVDMATVNRVIIGWFGVENGKNLPRTADPYFPCLADIEKLEATPEFIGAIKADAVAAGKSLKAAVVMPTGSGQDQTVVEDGLADHPFAKEFGWSPEVVAIAQAYAVKKNKEAKPAIDHFNVLGLRTMKPEDVAAYLTMAYHSNEVLMLKKILERDGTPISFAKATIEKNLSGPITLSSNSADVNRGILNLMTEMAAASA